MKHYEEDTPHVVPTDKFLVVRADGHHFSRVTSGYQKPQDDRIKYAMIQTTIDLLEEFQALTAYTQSDEITLVFPACTTPEHVHMNTGRAQKIASRVAGYCSVRFVYHIASREFNQTETVIAERAKDHSIYFDARVIMFPSRVEVANHMVWRSRYDALRNSTSALGRHHLGSKTIDHKSGKQVRVMLRQEKERRLKLLEDKKEKKPEKDKKDQEGGSKETDSKDKDSGKVTSSSTDKDTKDKDTKDKDTKDKDTKDNEKKDSGKEKKKKNKNQSSEHEPGTGVDVTSITWEEQDGHFKWGTYVKKQLYITDAVDRKTGLTVKSQRSKDVCYAFPITASEYFTDLLFAKYWPEDFASKLEVLQQSDTGIKNDDDEDNDSSKKKSKNSSSSDSKKN